MLDKGSQLFESPEFQLCCLLTFTFDNYKLDINLSADLEIIDTEETTHSHAIQSTLKGMRLIYNQLNRNPTTDCGLPDCSAYAKALM